MSIWAMSIWVYLAVVALWVLVLLLFLSLCVVAARGDRQRVQSARPHLKLVGGAGDETGMQTQQTSQQHAEHLRALQPGMEAHRRTLAVAALDAELARLQAEDAERRKAA